MTGDYLSNPCRGSNPLNISTSHQKHFPTFQTFHAEDRLASWTVDPLDTFPLTFLTFPWTRKPAELPESYRNLSVAAVFEKHYLKTIKIKVFDQTWNRYFFTCYFQFKIFSLANNFRKFRLCRLSISHIIYMTNRGGAGMSRKWFWQFGKKWKGNVELSLVGKEKWRKFWFYFCQRKWKRNGKVFNIFASEGIGREIGVLSPSLFRERKFPLIQYKRAKFFFSFHIPLTTVLLYLENNCWIVSFIQESDYGWKKYPS